MKQTLQKLKRVKPLIRSKKAIFDEEVNALANIKEEKIKAIDHLRHYQTKYMESANQINHERTKGDHKIACALEPALEVVKSRWHDSVRAVRKIEAAEKEQLQKVLDAQKDLKTFEQLEEQYQDQFKKLEKMKEQKELDELALIKK